ncbi:pol protein [Cucumis melo var. makuwa]|uniref:Pol protein n=1 Tax=Cucumis melo var. makuwa TaxID=1194695 RepID=A0A5A7TVQ5_CUCMM|nr:pol protein [Cucumis melo var. makuwa]
MHTAQSRQKSYADVRRKDLEFEVGDKVFLKVAPMRGVLRFERRGKLSPRFVGSFEILEQIGPVAYRLALPPSLSTVHDVFHVSMLRKYVPDPSHVVDYEPLEIDENLSYTEQPVEVLAREVKTLRNKEIPLVKVLWRNHRVKEATWEREDDMSFLSSAFAVAIQSLRLPLSVVVPFPSPSSESHCSSLRLPRPSISELPLDLTHPDAAVRPSFHRVCRRPVTLRRVEAEPVVGPLQAAKHFRRRTPKIDVRGIKELTYKFSGSAAGLFEDSFPFLGVDSIERHNRESGKGFPTTGPRIEAGNVVIHRRLHVTRPLVVACALSGVRSYLLVDPDAGCSCTLRICAFCGSTRLIFASFGSTRLICASFGSTRLICASFGITRLIGVSFGITRLICAFYGTTRLLLRAQLGADRREAGRMREGHMDASDLLIASADVDALGVDSIKEYSQVSDRHRCPDVLCIVVMLVGYVVNWNSMSMDYEILMLCKVEVCCRETGYGVMSWFSIDCEVTVSFIYGVVYLIGKSMARGRPARGKKDAEGHMDVSDFLYASADVFYEFVFFTVVS